MQMMMMMMVMMMKMMMMMMMMMTIKASLENETPMADVKGRSYSYCCGCQT